MTANIRFAHKTHTHKTHTKHTHTHTHTHTHPSISVRKIVVLSIGVRALRVIARNRTGITSKKKLCHSGTNIPTE
jgi:hypothetical protein